ncbi:MAG: flippase-like domain-containing protein, partial [Thermomicrobia bacterium]|nr:flippase-like domain-containing protein [Thermomicrobia bacterium]
MSRRSFALQRIRRWLPRLLGLALSVVAIAIVGPRKVMTGLGAANPWLVAIAAVAVFPLLAPKARRWQIVLADFGIALPWRDAFRFYAIGLWAAIITPGQLGDGLKAWYVQSRGGNLAPALASVVVDRLFDVLMLLGAASIGAAIYGAAFGAQFVVVGILTVVT